MADADDATDEQETPPPVSMANCDGPQDMISVVALSESTVKVALHF